MINEKDKRKILFYGSLLDFIDSKVHLSTSMPCMRACAWQNQYKSVWMNQQNDIYDPKFWETAEETCGIIEFVYDNEVFLYHDNGMSPYDIMREYINTVYLKSPEEILAKATEFCKKERITFDKVSFEGVRYIVEDNEILNNELEVVGTWDGETITFNSREGMINHRHAILQNRHA